MAERGVEVDHATLNRWVVRFSPTIAANLAGLQSLNVILKFTELVGSSISFNPSISTPARQGKRVCSRVNIVEQDHRFIKKITRSESCVVFQAVCGPRWIIVSNVCAHSASEKLCDRAINSGSGVRFSIARQ